MIKTKLHLLKTTLTALFCASLVACVSPDKGRNLNDPSISGVDIAKQSCSNCHGLNGQSISQQFPKLAGQQLDYIKAQLTDFKGHVRKDINGTQYMWGITNLTTKQVEELAIYFSTQPAMKGTGVRGPDFALGESIFKNGLPSQGVLSCNSCHGPEALGVAEIPRLAGQHSNYLYKQIMVFKMTDDRPRGQAMKQIIHNMNEDQAKAVASYLSYLDL